MKIRMKILKLFVSLVLVTVFIGACVSECICAAVELLSSYTLETVPEFSVLPYVKINGNEPYFTGEEDTSAAFESYSPLDELGRCGVAFALVCLETMPTGERGSISSVTPTGWVQNKYETDVVSGGYIYNRCHLIGWQLTGENANKFNLITGTRYLNIDGMVGFENSVAEYVKSENGHVLYRVTPVFEGDNLLASGVLMEGYSVDDNGEEIEFCVYCYNVQPGITIDYKTGANKLTVEIVIIADGKRYVYVLNMSTKKYHTPGCTSNAKISANNRAVAVGCKDCPGDDGYAACKTCKPDINAVLSGDADMNGTVTVSDARLVLRCAINLDVFTDVQNTVCDTDISASISVSDARTVLRISIGLE